MFVINTSEKLVYDIITQEKNIKILKDALAWQNLVLEIKVNKLATKEEIQKNDFQKLKKLGIDFKIKGEKNEQF